MKQNILFRKFFLLVTAFAVLLFFNCKHDTGGKIKKKEPVDLKLISLEIHETEVDIDKKPFTVKLTQDKTQVVNTDIKAVFNIADVTGLEVRNSPVSLVKNETEIVLYVPAKKDIYNETSITVIVKKQQKPQEPNVNPFVTDLIISGNNVKGVTPKNSPEQAEAILKGYKNQVIEMKGTQADFLIASEDKEWDKDSCKINGEINLVLAHSGYKSVCYKTIKLGNVNEETVVNFEVSVGNIKQEYSFKIKRIAGTVDLPDLSLLINDKAPKPKIKDMNYKLQNNIKPVFHSLTDTAKIKIISDWDNMKSIKVVSDGGNETELPITDFSGTKFYAETEINGINKTGKNISVIIEPKDTSIYHMIKWNFILKLADEDQNAEFKLNQSGKPDIKKDVKWFDGGKDRYLDEYGVISVKLVAKTVMKDSSVRYKIVNPDGSDISGQTEKIMINNGDCSHSSEEIIFFSDKPTSLCVWVIAKDGVTTDDERGKWEFTFNPVKVYCGYEKKTNFADVQKQKNVYDSIKIDRNKVSNNKIYLACIIWQEYSFDKNLPDIQTAFEELQKKGNKKLWGTEIDVSNLLNGNVSELEVKIPLRINEQSCFTYKIKLSL